LKSPICPFDAKSGVLCARCDEKLHAGNITQDDVDAAVTLMRVANESQDVDRFTLARGARVDEDYVLVLRGSDVMSVRANPSLAERIEKEFGHKVHYVESETSERGLVESLFHPARVISVNQFYLPDGNKVTKAVVAGRSSNQKVNVEKIQKIAMAVKNMELLVEFEQR
jgi:transcription antitermination factor NusA-like protein